MIKISQYLDERLVAFLQVNTRDGALQTLVDLIDSTGRLSDKKAFYDAILDREKIVTTGIGMGVAIPHAKLHEFDTFFIAIGILKQGVDWQALDGAPVRLIIMIGGPDDKQTEYLQILSSITQALKNEERRRKLLTVQNSEAVIQLFKNV